MQNKLTKHDITTAFADMALLLQEQQTHGEIYLVGSAAITMAYDSSRNSFDVDARINRSRHAVLTAAQIVGTRNGWDQEWLNESAATYIPDIPDLKATVVFNDPSLLVQAASPEILLAMKTMAAREKDQADIAMLVPLTQMRTLEELLSHAKGLYPNYPVAYLTEIHIQRIQKALDT